MNEERGGYYETTLERIKTLLIKNKEKKNIKKGLGAKPIRAV
jgi:hypothetical protein